MKQLLDIHSKSSSGSISNANPDVAASTSSNLGGNFTSDRKRSISLGIKCEEEESNECDDNKRRASVSDTTFDASAGAHFQSSASKKPKLESSPTSATQVNSSPENSPPSSKGLG